MDHIVQEVPVYVSKAFAHQLYLLQHPLTPINVSLESWKVKEAKFRPSQEVIRITREVNTKIRYDKHRESLPIPTAPHHESHNHLPPERERVMETQSLPNSAKSSRYVIGIIQGGKLCFSPIKSILEMREKYPRFIESDKEESEAHCDEANSIQTESEIEPTKVNIKFSQVREPGAKPKAKSYSAHCRHGDEEPWIQLAHAHDSKKFLNTVRMPFETEVPHYLSPRDYLDLLFPKHVQIDTESHLKKTSHHIPVSEMKNLSLGDQLRQVMSSAKLVRYSDLVELFKSRLGLVEIDDAQFLSQIQNVAVLVQGCWAVKSEIIYPPTYVSNAHGIPGPEMKRARNIILRQFTEKRMLQRRQMVQLTKLPVEEVTEILSDFATAVHKTGWEFKLTFDTQFVSSFPDVVQRQGVMREIQNSNLSAPPNSNIPGTSQPQRKAVSFSPETDYKRTGGKKRSHKKK